MIVVADTSPLSYLLLVEQVDLLPQLYGRVMIPEAVYAELRSEKAPLAIHTWIANPAAWLEIRKVNLVDPFLENLGAGEGQAIMLAQETGADLLLLDDWDARQEAQRRQLRIAGTLRVLEDAARVELIELPKVIAKLQATNFRIDSTLVQSMLKRDADWKKHRHKGTHLQRPK